MTRVALCFPGQGSQVAGMGDGLLDRPLARLLLDVAAQAGQPLEDCLRQGDDDALRPTEVAQPALLLVETVLAAELGAGIELVGVAGHSVGEYAALVAGGALDATSAMELVIARGRAMAAMREGTMAALLGASEELAAAICEEASRSVGSTVVIANLNGPGQVVISGTVGAVEAASSLARQRGVRKVVRLRVSGAFHSPLMAPAAAEFAPLLEATRFEAPVVPVVCNVDPEPVTEPDQLRRRLIRQLQAPVRWAQCVATLVDLGAEVLIEVGPGEVLSGLARRIAPAVPRLSVATLAEALVVGRATAAVHGG